MDGSVIGSGLTSLDLSPGSLQGHHFTGLTSASIADLSISGKKLTTNLLGDEHFKFGTLQGEDLKLLSLPGSIFLTDQFEGNLLQDDAINSTQILTGSLKSINFADHSVGAENIASLSIVSRLIATGSVQTNNMQTGFITTRTLAPSAVTSTLLAKDSIQSAQFQTDALPGSSIALDTIPSRVLAPLIFSGSRFASGSVTQSQWVSDLTLTFDDLPISEVSEDKLSSAVSLDASYILSGAMEARVNNLAAIKIKDRNILDEHFKTNELTETRLALDSLTASKLQSYSLRERHFSPNSLDDGSFANSAVSDSKIQSNTLQNNKIDTETLGNQHFKDNTLTSDRIKSDSLPEAVLDNAALSGSHFKPNDLIAIDFSVGAAHSTHVLDGSLTDSQVQTGSLKSRNLSTNTLVTADFALGSIREEHFQTGSLQAQHLKTNSMNTRVFEDQSFSASKFFRVDEFTQLLIHSNAADGSTTVTDSSDTEHAISVLGNAKHKASQSVFGNSSLFYDSPGDSLRIADSSDFTLGTQDFTIDFWVYSALSGSDQDIFSQYVNNSNRNLIRRRINDRLQVILESGATDIDFNSDLVLPGSQWVHVAVVRTSTKIKVYFDGIESGGITIGSGQNISSISADLHIGTQDGSANSFVGYLDEFRYSVGIARWTSNFTPPKVAYQGIGSDQISSQALTNSLIAGSLTSTEIALSTLTDREITDGSMESKHIIDSSFDGTKFIDASIRRSVLKSHSLTAGNFQSSAFETSDFISTLNISDKVSLSADIQSSRIQLETLSGVELSQVVTYGFESILASEALSYGKLISGIKFTSDNVINASFTRSLIANNQLSTFASQTISSGDFSSSSTGISSKIAPESIADRHLLTSALTSVKLTGSLQDSSLQTSVIQGQDFADLSIDSNEIENSSIGTDQLTDETLISRSAGHIPSLSASKFAAVTGGQISDDIFTSTHFVDGFFESKHLDQITADKFEENTIGSSQITLLGLTESDFKSNVILASHITESTLGPSQLAAGSLTEGNLQTEALQSSHFQDQSIAKVDLDTSAFDGLFSGNDVDPGNHMHSAFAFLRTTPTGYTLLDDDRFGRTQFAYSLKASSLLTIAQDSCSTDKAQVCDINQLLDICRSGTSLNDDFYFSGNPSHVSTASQDYLITPRLKLQSSNCFEPQSMAWDFGTEALAPVFVNATGDPEVRDISYFQNRYIVKLGGKVYNTSEALVDSSSVLLTNDATPTAGLIKNRVDNKLYTYGQTKVRQVNANLDGVDNSSSTYGLIQGLDFYFQGTSSAMLSYNTQADLSGEYKITLTDNSGDAGGILVLGKYRENRSVETRKSSGGIQDGHALNYTPNSWVEILSNNASPGSNQFSQRSEAPVLSYNGNLWIMGGQDSGGQLNDVWSSSTGNSWTEKLSDTGSPGSNQFSQRYRHSGAVYESKLWVIGGDTGSDLLNDIWNSNDGITWNQTSGATEQYTNLLVHSNTTDGNTVITDASSSSHILTVGGDVHHETDQKKFGTSSIEFDGKDHWEETTSSAAWVGRDFLRTLAFNSKLWVLGGDDGSSPTRTRNDVFSSSDGETWTQVLVDTATPGANQFTRRARHGAAVFSNKMWVIAGATKTEDTNTWDNKIWHSGNGSTWTEVTSPYEQFTQFLMHSNTSDGATSFSDESNSNHGITTHGDVHHETDQKKFGTSSMEFDGIDYWTEHTDSAPFGNLSHHGGLSFNSKLWVLGGLQDGTNPRNFVYNTSDGANWTQVLADTGSPSGSQWSQRYGHATTVFSSKLWVLGGRNSGGRNNEIWNSSNGSTWTSVSSPIEQYMKLLVHSDSNDGNTSILDSSSSNHSITVSGNVHHETDQKKFNATSIEFDGQDFFEETTASAAWDARYNHEAVVFNSKLWVIGGDDGTAPTRVRNDVYSSTDGETWTQVLADAKIPDPTQFTQRASHAASVFSNKIWVIGGETKIEGGSTQDNKIWHSTDGATWTAVTTAYEEFTQLLMHSNSTDGNTNFSDESSSGHTITTHGTVHHETDQKKFGTSSIEFDGKDFWTKHADSAPWGELYAHESVVHSNKLWILGGITSGQKNFVFSSNDGTEWTTVLANTNSPDETQWSQRSYHAATVFDNEIWVLGGHDGSDKLNDVWHSSNGSDWTQVSTPTEQYTKLLIHSSSADGTTIVTDASTSSHTISTNGQVHHEADQEKFGISSLEFDGVDLWEETTASAAWVARRSHGIANHNSKLWVIGGQDGSSQMRNDVYSSTDGQIWAQALGDTATPGVNQFSRRRHAGVTVFSDELWVIGGEGSGGSSNDVWHSSTGASWTKVNSPYEEYTKLLVHSNSTDGDTTVTDSSNSSHSITVNGNVHHETSQKKFDNTAIEFDGVDNWIETTSSADFSARTGHQVLDLSNTLYLTGGRDASGLSDEIWTSTDASTWTQKNTADSETVLLIHSDHVDNSTSFEDSSGNNHSISLPGGSNVHHDTSPSLFGNSAIKFDGTGDYLSVANSTDFQFGSGDFTIDFWVFLNNTNNDYSGFFGKQSNDNNRWYFAVTSSGGLSLFVKSSGNTLINLDWGSSIQTDGWNHIALVREGSSFHAFINGEFVSTETDNAAFPNFSDPLEIGRRRYPAAGGDPSGFEYLDGSIDEFRISKGVARWSSDFNVADGRYRQWEARSGHILVSDGSSLNVAGGSNGRKLTNDAWTSTDGATWAEVHWRTNLLVHSDSTDGNTSFSDSSDSKNNPGRSLTASGNVHHETDQKKFGNTSIYFDGSGDYLTTESSAEFRFGSDRFSIDLWVRFKGLDTLRPLVGQWSNVNQRWYLGVDEFGDTYFHAVDSGAAVINGNTSQWNTNFSANTWYHIALVRSGKTFELFVDGTSKGSFSDSSPIPTITSFGLNLGYATNGNGDPIYFKGYMDEVRISRGVARWTANFTPPTSPQRRFSARRDFAAVYSGSSWYIAGGRNASNAIADFWSTTDGVHWKEHATPSWSARYGHEIIVRSESGSDVFYVFGGNSGSGDLNDVWKSTDGENWTQVTASAGWSARSFHEVVDFNDNFWVLGGDASGTDKSDVWYSSNGSTWVETTFNANWSARSSLQATVFNDQVYIMGGSDGSLKNDVWKSDLTTPDHLNIPESNDFTFGSDDFTIDGWVYHRGSSKSQKIMHHKQDNSNRFNINITSNNQLQATYVTGGNTHINSLTTPISSLSANAWHHFALVHSGSNTYLFIDGTQKANSSTADSFGGINANLLLGIRDDGLRVLNGFLDEIRISKGIARWTSDFTPRSKAYDAFLEPRFAHGAVSFGGRLYVLGGYNGANYLSDVWSTSDSSGTSWTDHGEAPWSARGARSTVVYSSGTEKIWVMGGQGASGSTNDVWSTEDGNTWIQEASSSTWSARYGHSVVNYNGQMVLMGGYSTQNENDIWRSTNGTTWTQTALPAQWTARLNFGATVLGGKVWVTGGEPIAGTPHSDTWSSDLDEGKIDYLKISDSDDFNLSSNWTLDFWVYDTESAGAGERYILNHEVDTNNTWHIKILDDQKMNIVIKNGGSTVVSLTTTATLPSSQWVHIAIVSDGTNCKPYINGVNAGSASVSGTLPSIAADLFLGSHKDGKGVFKGSLDEIRLSNGIARWSQNFTPPTKAYEIFWDPVRYHGAITHNGRIWMMGGQTDKGRVNDVWSTNDVNGINWTYHGEAGWSPRRAHQAVSFDNKLWVMGGYDGGRLNDLWSSSDGEVWTEEGDADWSVREFFQATVLGGKMRVLGGTTASGQVNDVWSSSDGINWTSSTLESLYSNRAYHQVEVFNSKAYLSGGRQNPNEFSDVYSSDLEDLDVDFLTLADSEDWSPGTTNFTLDLWLYNQEATGNGTRSVVAQEVDTNNLQTLEVQSDNTLLFTYKNSGTTKVSLSSTSVLTQNQWVHVAVLRTGSNLKLYLDGKEAGSASVQGGGDLQDLSADLLIGANDQGNEVFDGYVDEIRWSKSKARWSADFTVMSKAYDAIFRDRHAHQALTYQSRLYVLGGADDQGNALSDVWSTTDSTGSRWIYHGEAPWSRKAFAASVFSDGTEKIWIFGGNDGSYKNDVWSTTDGATWTQESAGADWPTRSHHSIVDYSGTLVLVGGYNGSGLSDIWKSTNGVDWTQTSLPGPWSSLYGQGAEVMNNRVFVLGGWDDGPNTVQNTVWDSDLDESIVDFLRVTDSSDFTFGTGDFTLDFWVYDREGSEAGVRRILNQRVDDSNLHSLEILDNNTLRSTYKNGGTAKTSLDSSSVLTANQWIHVALVRNGSNLKFYFDGNEAGSGAVAGGGDLQDLAANLYLGSSEAGSKIISGYLDEVRVSKGVARWTTNFSVPGSPYETFWRARDQFTALTFNNRLWIMGGYDGSNRLNDLWSTGDSAGVSWTFHGDAAWEARDGFGATAFGGKIWVSGGETPTKQNDLWSTSDGETWTNQGNAAWDARVHHSLTALGDKLWLLGGTTSTEVNEIWSSSDGVTWTSNTLTSPWEARSGHSAPAHDGKIWLLGGSGTQGYSEVWSSEEPDYSKVDFLELADSTDWTPGTTDFTLDFWVYNTDYAGSGTRSIFSQEVDENNFHSLEILDNNKLRSTYTNGGSAKISLDSDTALATNQWVHVALVRSGSNLKFYLDGTASGSGSVQNGGDLQDLSAKVYLGGTGVGSEVFKGYVDEMRFNKGRARWTTDFTPMTRSYDAFITDRDGHEAVVFQDRLYILGGRINGGLNDISDVWSTSDATGVAWTYHGDAPWTSRSFLAATTFSDGTDKLWIFGGYHTDSSTSENDVWSSSDGETWTQVTGAAAWSKRYMHSVESLNGAFYVLGGFDGSTKNDIWKSTDGANWTQTTLPAQWGVRYAHDTGVFNDRVWVVGGNSASSVYNDTWSSDLDETKVDTLKSADSVDWTLGTQDFTLDFWVYDREGNGAGPRRIINQRVDDNNLHTLELLDNNLVRSIYKNSSNTKISLDSTVALTVGQWVHVALVRSGSDINLYLDGTQSGTTTVQSGGDLQDLGADLFLGSSEAGSRILSGYLDEVRLSKGIARWSANFTPPTRAYDAFFTPRSRHQTLVFNDRLYLIGGEGDGGQRRDLWSTNDPNGLLWTDHGDAPFASRRSFGALTFASKLWVLGGYDGASARDVWSTTDAVDWVEVDSEADWTGGDGLSVAIHTDPSDNLDKIWVLGGKAGATHQTQVWNSTNGSTWVQVQNGEWSARHNAGAAVLNEKLYLLSGDQGSRFNDVWEFIFPQTGTLVDYLTFKESDDSYAVQSSTLKLFNGDDSVHFHCPKEDHCYVSKDLSASGNILYYKADSAGLNPGFSIVSQNLSSLTGGESLTNVVIVHMNSSYASGASYIHFLADDGALYRLKLDSDGAPDSGAQIERIPAGFTPGGSYESQKARIHLKDEGNDEILVTGLENHIVVKKSPTQAKFACCRQALY